MVLVSSDCSGLVPVHFTAEQWAEKMKQAQEDGRNLVSKYEARMREMKVRYRQQTLPSASVVVPFMLVATIFQFTGYYFFYCTLIL